MSRCRRTDSILDIVADPERGVDALTDEVWQHIGICADCTTAVRGMQRLDGALNAAMRRLPHEPMPASILATPPVPRGREPLRVAPMLAAAAVVVLAVAASAVMLQWVDLRGIGVGPSSSAAPSIAPPPPSSPTPEASASASPTATPTPAATATPEPEPVRIAIGDVVAVVDEPLVVRTAPGTDPDSTLTADRLWLGQRVRILDGPADVDGYTWWEVQVGEIRGWVADAESDDSAPWLAPIADGRVWFWRYPGEDDVELDPELYSIHPNGSNEQDLGDPTAAGMRLVISCGASATPLQWTHDGTLAAFTHSAGGCEGKVYVMPSDASVVREFGDGWSPAWRPDGGTLAFAPNVPYLAAPEGGSGELRQTNVDAAPPEALTDSGTPLFAGYPSWSPDRTRIAYSGGSPEPNDMAIWTYEIYVADVETGEGRAIAQGMRPRWSPDGRWIVFERSADDIGTTELWRVRPDGADETLLGEGSTAEFSPDGTRVAFVRSTGLWTMAPDGSDASMAIPATLVDGYSWAPGGDAIVAASDYPDGSGVGISIVELDGAAPAITGLVTPGHAPSWQPVILAPAR